MPQCCQQGKDRSGDWTCDPTTLGGMCGATCHNDGQCRTGGLIMCGKCNTVGGTNYQNTCVADNTETPEPTPSPIEPMGKGCGDSKCRSADQDRPARVRWRQCAAPTTTDHSNTSASTSANLVLLLPRRQRLGNIPEVKEAGALRDAAAIATAVREASSCVAFATRSAALAASTLVSTHLLTN